MGGSGVKDRDRTGRRAEEKDTWARVAAAWQCMGLSLVHCPIPCRAYTSPTAVQYLAFELSSDRPACVGARQIEFKEWHFLFLLLFPGEKRRGATSFNLSLLMCI